MARITEPSGQVCVAGGGGAGGGGGGGGGSDGPPKLKIRLASRLCERNFCSKSVSTNALVVRSTLIGASTVPSVHPVGIAGQDEGIVVAEVDLGGAEVAILQAEIDVVAERIARAGDQLGAQALSLSSTIFDLGTAKAEPGIEG